MTHTTNRVQKRRSKSIHKLKTQVFILNIQRQGTCKALIEIGKYVHKSLVFMAFDPEIDLRSKN